MSDVNISRAIEECAAKINDAILDIISNRDADLASLYESMRYSAGAGGKRIRPFITCSVADMLSAPADVALSFAVAVEMIHTYSLIHDDLPCMDNDDFRRGKPTNHKVFGEAEALLAGDALLTMAFYVIANANCSGDTKARAVAALSEAAGASGMIGGQIIDIHSEGKNIDFELLVKMHSLKTGALIKCAAKLGAIAAECNDTETLNKIDLYASNVGLAFQIEDDILDEEEAKLSPEKNPDPKTTFMTFMSPTEAIEYAEKLTAEAKSAISGAPNSELLVALADHLLKRKV